MAEWAVLADDFTGAMDTGLQFAKAGLTTIFDLGRAPESAQVLVLTSDSRSLDPASARARALLAGRRAADLSRHIYKKVDSTLRGNIGPELEALLESTGAAGAVLAPAFPAQGRTTRGGVQLVRGTPVAQTEAGRDPLAPVLEDHVPRLIEQTSNLRVGHVDLDGVRSGSASLARRLRELNDSGCKVIVADADSDADLAEIAAALPAAGLDRLCAGSAGLAGQIVAGRRGAPPHVPAGVSTKVAVLAGSFSQVTRDQVEVAARELDARVCRPSVVDLARPQLALADARQALVKGQIWIAHPGQLDGGSLSGAHVQDLSQWMRAISAGLASQIPGLGLVMTGGETAAIGLGGIGAGAVRIVGEVQSGVAGGVVLGGRHEGMRIVTKAGAFGGGDALVAAVTWLLGRNR